MASLEERVSRLEGGYEHLATKADIAEVKADIARSKVDMIKWVAGIGIGVAALNSSVVLVGLRLMMG